MEFELNVANRRTTVYWWSLGCRHAWRDAGSAAFLAISGAHVSAACDVQDSTDYWDSATARLWMRRSPSHSGHRGCIRTSASYAQPTHQTSSNLGYMNYSTVAILSITCLHRSLAYFNVLNVLLSHYCLILCNAVSKAPNSIYRGNCRYCYKLIQCCCMCVCEYAKNTVSQKSGPPNWWQ